MRASTFFASLVMPFAVAVLADPHLNKRFEARVNYYDVEARLPYCGQRYKNTDFVAALNLAQFVVTPGYPGPPCYGSITITCNGKTAMAKIVDLCPECGFGGLDLSEGLFKHFAPLSEGVLTCDWVFSGGVPS